MAELKAKYGEGVGERELMSHTMYPKVYETYMAEKERYADP
jgi:pyruvate carboxylase